jgi:cytochrome c biogenesis factor
MRINSQPKIKHGIALFQDKQRTEALLRIKFDSHFYALQDKQRTEALLRIKFDSDFYALLEEHCTGKLHRRIARALSQTY